MTEPDRAGAPAELVPDMSQALADLRELKQLSTRFGVELIRCLASVAEGDTPHICGEVFDVPAVGTNHAIAHFKLAEHLQRCLAALRAWNGDLHVAHEVAPKMTAERVNAPVNSLRPEGKLDLRSSQICERLGTREEAPSIERFRLEELASAEHPLHSIPLPKEILEAAAEISGLCDGPGIERSLLEFVVRFVIFATEDKSECARSI